jgi:hypothetical protein
MKKLDKLPIYRGVLFFQEVFMGFLLVMWVAVMGWKEIIENINE